MSKLSAACIATLSLLLSPAAFAQDAPRADAAAHAPAMDAAARGQVIDALVRELNAYYVYPDVAAKVETALRAKQQRGGYDNAGRAQDLAEALTADIRAVANDLHLTVRASDTPMPPEPAGGKPGPAPDDARMLARMKELNYGLGAVEKLPGNIGYLEVRGFVPAKLSEQPFAAAMTQLADCDALIIDLRRNGGGDPAGVASLTSYLFDARTHLNDLYWREGDRTEEFWTKADVPGTKFGQRKPVYVLTSAKTFSGGEEFSNNLKVLQRATLVGETTGGGANPGRGHQLTPYFSAFIPNGRAINPITKTSWEHTGVTPDVPVAAADALAVAQKMAKEKLAAAVIDQSLAARIDAAIAPYFKVDEPGATVIVTKEGKTVFRKAYGMADAAKKVPMTPDTVLRLGSITKQFTSTAILMLAEEGKLSVSDDITKYLPDYPTHGKKITIEHLLTHTSGIASYTGKKQFRDNMTKDMTVAQMIDSFKNDPLDFEPGSKWRYNNSGYFLLGAIIEKVSGMPYARFVEQRIFVPLGMNNTAYEGYERRAAPHAAGHTAAAGHFESSIPLSMTQPYAAGSLVSTVDDLARWDAAVSSGRLLKGASWQQAFTPYVLPGAAPTNYGYGWMTGKLRGVPTIGHGGSINGFKSYALRLPIEKVYVAVLTNSDSGLVGPEVVVDKAAALAIGQPYPEFSEIKLDPKSLAAFTGVYKINDKETRTFRVEGGRLMMQRSGRGNIPVIPYSAEGFFIPRTLEHFEFERGAAGAATKVTQYSGDLVIVQPRVGDATDDRRIVKVPRPVLDTYLGRYQVSPQLIIDITRDGDHLYGQAHGQPVFELFAMSDTLFFVREVDAQVRFNKADDGSPQLVLSQNGTNKAGKKIN